MCHGHQRQFNHCHGGPQQINTCHQGPHWHMNQYHGGSQHQPARHEGCCSFDGFKRRFFGKLVKRNKQVKLEAKAVEEKVKELKGGA